MKKRLPLIVLLVVVLAVVGGYAVMLLGEKNSLEQQTTRVTAAYEAYQGALDEGDYEKALSSLHEVIDGADALEAGTNTWIWQLACHLPVVGSDAQTAVDAARIAKELTSQALLPVLRDVEDLLGESSTSDVLSVLAEKLGQANTLLGDIQAARTVVEDCRVRVDELSVKRSETLSNNVSQLQAAVTKADETLDALGPLLDEISALTGSVE